MAGTVVADTLQAASTSTLVLKNGVANTPPTIQDSAGTQIGTFCRAWVNFNGTGTVAIRASFNVSSITDNGIGDYTVNLTTAMPDANYAVKSSGANTLPLSASQGFNNGTASAPTSASAARVVCIVNSTTALTDLEAVEVAIFR
jgi:hypothetical protein